MDVGGHPPIISDEIPGWVIIASVDSYRGDPELETYQWDEFERWYFAALELMNEAPDEYDLYMAMLEVREEIFPTTVVTA